MKKVTKLHWGGGPQQPCKACARWGSDPIPPPWFHLLKTDVAASSYSASSHSLALAAPNVRPGQAATSQGCCEDTGVRRGKGAGKGGQWVLGGGRTRGEVPSLTINLFFGVMAPKSGRSLVEDAQLQTPEPSVVVLGKAPPPIYPTAVLE